MINDVKYCIMFAALSGSLYSGIRSLSSPTTTTIEKTIGLVCGLSALCLLFDRDVYLLSGEAIIPGSIIQENRMPAGANRMIVVNVPPNARVIFWAASQSKNSYKNAGVTQSDSDGKAIFRVRNPSTYGKSHVHYRYMIDYGLMSKMFTAPIIDARIVNGII